MRLSFGRKILEFFRPSSRYYLSSVHNCKDQALKVQNTDCMKFNTRDVNTLQFKRLRARDYPKSDKGQLCL